MLSFQRHMMVALVGAAFLNIPAAYAERSGETKFPVQLQENVHLQNSATREAYQSIVEQMDREGKRIEERVIRSMGVPTSQATWRRTQGGSA